MQTKELRLSAIRTDGGTQMRAEINKELFLEYRDHWKAGVKFPSIDVFFDGATYWLVDGFHRFYGAREASKETINCTVHNGSQREAILFAVGANRANGQRRTNADKRKAVQVLLNDEEWVKWSNELIADKAGVSHNFVNDVRTQLASDASSLAARTKDAPRKGKDGKSRKPPVRRTVYKHPLPVQHAEPIRPQQQPVAIQPPIKPAVQLEHETSPLLTTIPMQKPEPQPVKANPLFVKLRELYDAMNDQERDEATHLWKGWIASRTA